MPRLRDQVHSARWVQGPGPGQTAKEKELEDLRKAAWMIEREIERINSGERVKELTKR